MQVCVLLQSKGSEVVTVPPETSLADIVEVLHRHAIGAVVVSSDGRAIQGVLSERDVVAALHTDGPTALERRASEVMSAEVFTCGMKTTVEELMTTMTDHRVRHVPVVVDGALAGLVSIGDVVKDRISSLEHETKALHDYIANPY